MHCNVSERACAKLLPMWNASRATCVSAIAMVISFPVIEIRAVDVQSPIPRTYFGLHVNQISNEPNVPFGTLRLWDDGTNWKRINEARGQYDFRLLDKWIEFARRHHAEIIYSCGHTPDWAAAGGTDIDPPRDMRFWDDFISAIARHARGRIKYWEMWNEPNAPNFWRGSIPELVTMTRHARQIILAVDPSAKILSPAPAGGNGEVSEAPEWLDRFFEAGGGDSIDIVAFHGYLPGKPPETILATLRAIHHVMNAHHVTVSEIWDTESSWGRMEHLPDLERQANFVARHYLLHWSGGAARNCFYGWDSGEWGGLMERDTGRERPAARAYAEIYKWIVGATMTKPCEPEGGGTWSCSFTRPGGYQALAVWHTAGKTSYAVGAPYTQVRDLQDRITPVQGGPVEIGPRPVLIENNGIPAF